MTAHLLRMTEPPSAEDVAKSFREVIGELTRTHTRALDVMAHGTMTDGVIYHLLSGQDVKHLFAVIAEAENRTCYGLNPADLPGLADAIREAAEDVAQRIEQSVEDAA